MHLADWLAFESNPFRINTYKISRSKSFRMNTYKTKDLKSL